jgi:RNA polymerase sigma-70 factor (ECF subfamily)
MDSLMKDQTRDANAGNFEQVVMPHLDAAYNLARWLVGNQHDAEDVVQEAYLRAFKFFSGYRGGNARAWLLAIVRNTTYSFLEKNRPNENIEEFNEELHSADLSAPQAEMALLQAADSHALRDALEGLPVNFREIIVLRELEDMPYKQIAEVMGIPIGTVMSGLARGREKLRERLLSQRGGEGQDGLRK